MSEIDAPSNIAFQTGKGATQVTRASTTSDDNSAKQQSTGQKAHTPEKNPEDKKQSSTHETAVTLSSSLSNLEAGSKISAKYQGIDGQDRPLIISETGTYVVRYDPNHQPEIDKIPQGATLELKILKVEREIEARLLYRDPVTTKMASPPLSVQVTLELTGLGNAPPRVRTTADQNRLSLEKQGLSYQATDLYRAEHIARESAHKLQELPLPATTTNYTRFEKAIPAHDGPAIIRTALTGNALIAQELTIKTPPVDPQPIPAGNAFVSTDSLTLDVDKLLHRNTLATVIKTIPKVAVVLPAIVQKHFAATTPLDTLRAGSNFTLRIDSITIPDILPTTTAPHPAAEVVKSHPTDHKPPVKTTRHDPPPPISESQKSAAPLPGLSGIIIAPGQHILNTTDKSLPATSRLPATPRRQYPDSYNPPPIAQPGQRGALRTLYVATPVSIIKFQSPIDLKPGTVINFTLPEQPHARLSPDSSVRQSGSPDNIAAATTAPNKISHQSQPPQGTQPSGWTPTSLVSRPDLSATPPVELSQQPLENFVQNWQSLSQIISVLPVADGSSLTQNLNNRLPGIQNPAQMTSSMMFFFAAMGAKNPARVWLGPGVTQQLERNGQGKLLNMLDNDMQRIFRLGADTAPNEWRPTLIPLQIGGEVNAIPILTRQVPNEDTEEDNNSRDEDEDEQISATRFIVELDLTQFGHIQVDGLLKEKKLNIIIRSKIILNPEIRHKMTGMFTTALEISGYSGDLQFRDTAQSYISVQNIINQKIHILRP